MRPRSTVPEDGELEVRLESRLPASLAVGDGTTLLVVGKCHHPRHRIVRLTLTAGEAAYPVIGKDMPLLEDAQRQTPDGFWGMLEFGRHESSARIEVGIEATLDDGATVARALGSLQLVPSLEHPPASAGDPGGAGPLVAICIATYDPPPALLERQLESIRGQSHGRWICLISDDCSTQHSFDRLCSMIDGDARFAVSRSSRRLGFYGNFERALAMVPSEADFVALCDQDDRWYPEKLAVLLDGVGDATLIYSDMRVVEDSGRVVSESYWSRRRRNNHTNLASLLLANTVTGAASLFPRHLLDAALPFPPPFRKSYHDHWLASVALATGRISYVDRPLYDYVQHGTAVLGHSAANFGMSPRRLTRTKGLRAKARKVANSSRDSYFTLVCWTGALARSLELRLGAGLSPRRRRVVHRVARFARPPEPAGWLAVRSLRGTIGLNETMYNELYLLGGVLWRRLQAARARLRRLRALPRTGARSGPRSGPQALAEPEKHAADRGAAERG